MMDGFSCSRSSGAAEPWPHSRQSYRVQSAKTKCRCTTKPWLEPVEGNGRDVRVRPEQLGKEEERVCVLPLDSSAPSPFNCN